MKRAYNDPEYRAALAQLRAAPRPCVWCCDRVATELDHYPSIAEHRHVRGSGCCALLPACSTCNRGRGAALGNRRRVGRPGASRVW